MSDVALIPTPGTDLVPDGWCDSTVVPWLAEQTDDGHMAKAEATLAGLEAAYRTIGADIFEITKARRLLELRWGELLGRAQRGGDRKSDQVASGRFDSLDKDSRSRFRRLAEQKDVVLAAINRAEDAEDLSRSAVLRVAQRAARPERPVVEPPTGQYAVILADPPWRYEGSETEVRAIENQYPTMTLQEIEALPCPAADDAVLFLWITSPKLCEGLAVMEAWGFSYRTCAVWVKDRIGMGYYFRQRHELLLVGRRGSMPVPEPGVRPDSVIDAPRGRHSEKPSHVHDLIAGMYPDRTKIELFARRNTDGWDHWGNE